MRVWHSGWRNGRGVTRAVAICVSLAVGLIPVTPSVAAACEGPKVLVSPKSIKFIEEPKAGEEASEKISLHFTNDGPGEFNLEGVLFTYKEGAGGSFSPQTSLTEPCKNIAVGGKCELLVKFTPKAGKEKFVATMTTNQASEPVTVEGKSK